MKITGMTTHLVDFDISGVWGDGPIPAGLTNRYAYPLHILHTDDGIDGYTTGYGGMGERVALAHLPHEAYLMELVGENPLHVEKLWRKLKQKNRHMYNLTDATLGVLDVALWDIVGKAFGQPVAKLLGLARTQVPTYATARTIDPTPEQVYEEAKRRKAEGFRAFKVQFWDGPERDIPRFRAAREGVGPGFPLMQDAASGYTFPQAMQVGRVLEELDYHWFEEPIGDRQLGLLKKLCDELDIPVLATEIVRLDELAEFLRHGATDIVRGDVLIKGGITGLRKAAAACELFGLNIELHGLGSPLLDVGNLHVGCAIANSKFLEAHHPLFASGLQGDPLAVDGDGCRRLPAGPGLGVAFDWDWIANHTVQVIRD